MKTTVAFAIGFLSLGLLGAAPKPGGMDKIELSGSLPEELAEDETMEELVDRVIGWIAPFDHIMTPPCGNPRRYQFLPMAEAQVNDSLSDRYAAGELRFYVIKVRSTGCGQSRIHNLYAFERRGPYHIILVTPGATLANLKTQLDVQRALYDTVAVKDKCADEAMILDTVVLEPPLKKASWTEVWTAQTCGVSSRYRILFTQDGSRVSYSIMPMI
jgi:hypothetical protein